MATFRKLADGSWGITGPSTEIVQGNRVRVNRRDGSIQLKIVGQVMGWEGDLLVARCLDIGQTTPAPTTTNNGNGNGYHPVVHPPIIAPAPVVITPPVVAATPTPPTMLPTPTSSELQPQFAPIEPTAHKVDGEPIPEVDGETVAMLAQRLGSLVTIHYDITVASGFPNPSGIMHSCGFFRGSGSSWVGEESRIPWRLIHQLVERGFKWGKYKLDDSEKTYQVIAAISVLTKEIRQLEASIQKTIATAGHNLAEAMIVNGEGVAEPTEKQQRKYQSTVEQAIKQRLKKLEELRAAARAFGIESILEGERNKMASIVNGMRQVAARQAEAYERMVGMAKGSAMQAAADMGDIPPGILADFLADEGHDVTEEQEVFTD